VGLVLRSLGIHARRVTVGYKIVLTDAVRERIHFVARCYQVLSLEDGVVRCPQCLNGNRKKPVTSHPT